MSHLYPIKDLIAFKWIRPRYSQFILANSVFDLTETRVGKYYIGKVLKVGPDVKGIKKNDKILFHEFSIINKDEEINEDSIYFIRSKEIPAKVDKSYNGIIDRIFSSSRKEKIINS